AFDAVLSTSLLAFSQSAIADDNDWDNNPATDRYVEIAWADVSAQASWPGVLPTHLFDVQFKLSGEISNDNDTQIGFSPIDTGLTQNDQGKAVLYALKAPIVAVAQSASNNKFDFELDGQSKPFTDGILLIRYLFGFRNDTLINGAVSEDATVTTAVEIQALLQAAIDNTSLDIDGDGQVKPLSDGLLTLRYLFGIRGDILIHQAVSPEATRTTAVEIEAYLAQFIL
ncbi:MAG: hypothetical protein MJK04_10990, partial [Psychrosphaera sp.]|nr:hypothetical protein [Psychrosphaera sp.]